MSTMTQPQLERYGIERQFHLSAMGRTLNGGDLIELNRQQSVLRINRGKARR